LYEAALVAIERLSHRFDSNVLTAMLALPALKSESFSDPEAMAGWTRRLEARLAESGLGKPRYSIRAQAPEGNHPGALVIERQHHGLGVTQTVAAGLFDSGELRPVTEAARQLADLIQPGAQVRRGG